MKFRRWRLWFIFLVVLLPGLALPAYPAAVQAQSTALVAVTPATSDVVLSSTTTVTLYVTGGVNVNAFDVSLLYDPAIIRLASWSSGPYLSGLEYFIKINKPSDGILHLAAFQKGLPGVSGDGILLNLVFTGQSYGLSSITLDNVVFSPPSGGETYPARQNGTLAVHGNPAQPFTVTGTFKMQGRTNTAGILVSLSKLNWFGPYNATTTNLPTNNLNINPIYGDIYRITTNQPRYLNITTDLNKTKTITASTTLSTLMLWGGNAVWTDNIIDTNDLALVAGAFGDSGPSLAADVNFSGKVDLFDLTLVAGNYGLTSAAAYQSWTP